MNTYYVNNYYFGDIIKSYFENLKYNYNDKNPFYYNIDYTNKKCKDCNIINQLDNINLLGNKKLQYENMLNYYNYKPKFIPKTYVFDNNNYHNLKKIFNKDKYFILKPENSLGRKGVLILNKYSELIININKYTKYKNWIIQEFISNCLLYKKKKFHIRLYVILIINKNKISVYIQNNGFLYLAINDYDMNKVKEYEVGLSGEKSEQQVKLYPENFIAEFGNNNFNKINNQIIEIVKSSITCVKDKLSCPNKNVKNNKCYKLFGYDLLVDNLFNVYLLEINARIISLKYPPVNFKNNMYTNILNLIIKNEENSFYKIDIDNKIKSRYNFILIIILFLILNSLYVKFKNHHIN